MKKTLMTIVLTISVLFSFAQTKLLKGTISNIPIVMQLSEDYDSVWTGDYFYAKQRKNIYLNGKRNSNGTISLISSTDYGGKDPNEEQFELKEMNDIYTGTWLRNKKKLPVQLKVVTVKEQSGPYDELLSVQDLKWTNPYEYVLASGYAFNKDSSTLKNGYYIDWYKEKYTGMPMVQVRNDKKNAAIEKVNLKLKEKTIAECVNASMCSSPGRDYEYTGTIKSVFINSNIFSSNTGISFYCGAAYPGFSGSAYNLNMKTGEEIKIEDVISFGMEISPGYEDTQTYRSTVFRIKVAKLFNELYPAEVKSEYENGCEFDSTEWWSDVNWYFTDKGLHIEPVYPRALLPCSYPQWAVIPYNILRKYRTPKSRIQLPVD